MTETVLHLITRLEPGGAQRNTLYTVAHLDREHYRPALAWGPGDALDEEARTLDDVLLYEIPQLVRQVAPARDGAAVARLRRLLRELRPAVVHTHSSKAGILGRLAARLERVPVVVHSIHGFGFTPLQPALLRWIFFTAEKVVARWTDHFVAVSRANRDLGVELGLFCPASVSVIRSGIELQRFAAAGGRHETRRRLGLPEHALVVTQVGNFKPQKAPLDFVRMAAVAAEQVPEAHFVMVGDGVLRDAAEALAAELGLGRRMVFPGWWQDVPGLLAATDVSVLSSRHEGLPRAVVESLAAGVPVVATAVDGTPEVVQHGVNGFLAEAGDTRALARRLCTLLEDPGLRRRMGAAASAGLADFDIDLMVRQQEELYACLLGRSRS